MGWPGLTVSRPSNASLALPLRFNLQLGSLARRDREGGLKYSPVPAWALVEESSRGDEGNKEYPCVSA
jgi:hypothetical protein